MGLFLMASHSPIILYFALLSSLVGSRFSNLSSLLFCLFINRYELEVFLSTVNLLGFSSYKSCFDSCQWHLNLRIISPAWGAWKLGKLSYLPLSSLETGEKGEERDRWVVLAVRTICRGGPRRASRSCICALVVRLTNYSRSERVFADHQGPKNVINEYPSQQFRTYYASQSNWRPRNLSLLSISTLHAGGSKSSIVLQYLRWSSPSFGGAI